MEIEQKINKIKKELVKFALSGHEMLLEQRIESSELPAAHLMLIAASIGDNDFNHEALIPCAVGLELLRHGVAKHYNDSTDSPSQKNLDIVTADYYYAQAINLAVPFNRGEILAYLAKAIMDVAEAETIEDGLNKDTEDVETSRIFFEKDSGIYKAAVRLGLVLSGVAKDQVLDVLIDYAVLYAMIKRSKDNDLRFGAGDPHIDSLRQSVLERLKFLPARQHKALVKMVA